MDEDMTNFLSHFCTRRKESGRLRGFTLVELSLSMTFIAILSIIIVLVINGAVSSYSRGITLNLINTVGNEVVDELKTAIHQAPKFDTVEKLCSDAYGETGDSYTNCKEDGARGLISVSQKGSIVRKSDNSLVADGVPIYGALCLGNYSYIWNSGYLFDPEYYATIDGEDSVINNPFFRDDDTSLGILELRIWESPGGPGNEPQLYRDGSEKMMRVKDEERWVCKEMMNYENDSPGYLYQSQKTLLDETGNSLLSPTVMKIGENLTTLNPTDIITNDSRVAVYDLKLNADPVVGDGVLYSLSVTLGTVRSGIDVNAEKCVAPNESGSNRDYCAINRFNITALANGGKGND